MGCGSSSFYLSGRGQKDLTKRFALAPGSEYLPAELSPEWRMLVVGCHNVYRTIHQVPELTWSDECFIKAKRHALACQTHSQQYHESPGLFERRGRNIAFGSPTLHPKTAMGWWYDENENFNWDDMEDPRNVATCRHFAQIVWKDVKFVGLAVSSDQAFVVADYRPPGKIMVRKAGQSESEPDSEADTEDGRTGIQQNVFPKAGTA